MHSTSLALISIPLCSSSNLATSIYFWSVAVNMSGVSNNINIFQIWIWYSKLLKQSLIKNYLNFWH